MNDLISGEEHRPVFVITPTYTRETQLAELTIQANALEHIPFLQWIVVEITKTSLVTNFLATQNISYTHLDNNGVMDRSVNWCNVLRNTALAHLKQTQKNSTGVILFANLDRIYNSELFYKVKNIKKVGIWPTVFAKEQFQCNPLKFSNNYPKYPINLGSVGFSTALLHSELEFPPLVSDTEAISLITDGLISSDEEIEVISCSQQLVWFISIF